MNTTPTPATQNPTFSRRLACRRLHRSLQHAPAPPFTRPATTRRHRPTRPARQSPPSRETGPLWRTHQRVPKCRLTSHDTVFGTHSVLAPASARLVREPCRQCVGLSLILARGTAARVLAAPPGMIFLAVGGWIARHRVTSTRRQHIPAGRTIPPVYGQYASGGEFNRSGIGAEAQTVPDAASPRRTQGAPVSVGYGPKGQRAERSPPLEPVYKVSCSCRASS